MFSLFSGSAPARIHPDLNMPATVTPPVQPPKPRKTLTPTALKLKAIKLKMAAVGESQIMDVHRWYLEVVLLDGTAKSVFVGDEWAFGRASESIKRILNVDAQHEKARLRDAAKLDVDLAPGGLVKNVIANGASLQFVSASFFSAFL